MDDLDGGRRQRRWVSRAHPGLDLAGPDGGQPPVAEVRVDVPAQVRLHVRAGGRRGGPGPRATLGVLADGGRVVGVDVVAADEVGGAGGQESLGVDASRERSLALCAGRDRASGRARRPSRLGSASGRCPRSLLTRVRLRRRRGTGTMRGRPAGRSAGSGRPALPVGRSPGSAIGRAWSSGTPRNSATSRTPHRRSGSSFMFFSLLLRACSRIPSCYPSLRREGARVVPRRAFPQLRYRERTSAGASDSCAGKRWEAEHGSCGHWARVEPRGRSARRGAVRAEGGNDPRHKGERPGARRERLGAVVATGGIAPG